MHRGHRAPASGHLRAWPVGRGRRVCAPRRGFTLTESLIASVVLAACVIGIGGTLGISYRNSQRLDENAVATSLARQMMEQMVSKPYAQLPAYRGLAWSAVSSLPAPDGTAMSLPGGGTYTRRSDVQYFDRLDDIEGAAKTNLNPLPPIAVVTATVTAPGGRSVSLTQIVAQR